MAVLPAGADSAPVIQDMRKIMADYAANGVPADLVEAAKRREIAGAEFRRNSIPGLAEAWSDALAAEGRNSPDDDVEAMKRVTVEDVNRLAKTYLVDQASITAELKPAPSGEAVASNGFGGAEQLTAAPIKPVELPAWASSQLLTLKLPPAQPAATDMILPNGLRLIVRTVKVTPTVTVVGISATIRTWKRLADKTAWPECWTIFSYGTKNLDRLAFQKALDDIAADESAGFEFSLQVLKQDFTHGVQLLADNELNPALPEQAFNVLKPQTAQFVAGQLRSPGYRAGRALDSACSRRWIRHFGKRRRRRSLRSRWTT